MIRNLEDESPNRYADLTQIFNKKQSALIFAGHARQQER